MSKPDPIAYYVIVYRILPGGEQQEITATTLMTRKGARMFSRHQATIGYRCVLMCGPQVLEIQNPPSYTPPAAA